MTQPRQQTRSERLQASADAWFRTVVPWVGTAAAITCLLTNHPEGIVPFTGLAALPSVVKAQRKRNGRR